MTEFSFSRVLEVRYLVYYTFKLNICIKNNDCSNLNAFIISFLIVIEIFLIFEDLVTEFSFLSVSEVRYGVSYTFKWQYTH